MGPESSFELFNDSMPESVGFCFLRGMTRWVPESMAIACGEYIEGSVSCEDAHSRWELCVACAEEWEANL